MGGTRVEQTAAEAMEEMMVVGSREEKTVDEIAGDG